MSFLDTRIARWAAALLVTVHAACPAAEAGTVLRVGVGENINEAVVRARALPKPVTLRLDAGVHELSGPLSLGPEDSGKVIAERGAGGETVVAQERVMRIKSAKQSTGTFQTNTVMILKSLRRTPISSVRNSPSRRMMGPA